MRNDMAKVLVERPRHGSGFHYRKKGRYRDLDELPTKEAMRPKYPSWDQKYLYLNENLAPLRRFLSSRVGRRWDTIYAEISAHLRPTSAVQQHVRGHLSNFVEKTLNVNKAGNLEHNSGLWQPSLPYYRKQFYVDPRDGILKQTIAEKERQRRARQCKQQATERRAREVVLGPMTELYRIEGLWYLVAYAHFPAPICSTCIDSKGVARTVWTWPMCYDVFRNAHVNSGTRYAAHKRLLTKKEQRLYGVNNQIVWAN